MVLDVPHPTASRHPELTGKRGAARAATADQSAGAGAPSLVKQAARGRVAAGLAVFASGPALLGVTVAYGFPLTESGSPAARALAVIGVGVALFSVQAALFIGALEVCRAFRERCSGCRGGLETHTLYLPLEDQAKVLAACRTGGPLKLLELARGARPRPDADELTALEVEVCSGCCQAGRLTVSRVRFDPHRERYVVVDGEPCISRSGWILAQLARVADERRAALGQA